MATKKAKPKSTEVVAANEARAQQGRLFVELDALLDWRDRLRDVAQRVPFTGEAADLHTLLGELDGMLVEATEPA